MENPITNNSHNESVRKAKEYYKKVGCIWSPVLDDYVAFNNVGFTHLLRKQGIPRVKSEQKRRLKLLGEAVEIIKDPVIITEYQRKDILSAVHSENEKVMVSTRADFWKLIREKDGRTTIVVVRQIEGGSKHFFSVYAKKQKTAR